MKNTGTKRKKTIPAPVRKESWDKYIGNNVSSKCLCCNHNDIHALNFDCGHIIAESKGGKTIVTNLRPICSPCNKSMGSKDMITFMKQNGYDVKRLDAKDNGIQKNHSNHSNKTTVPIKNIPSDNTQTLLSKISKIADVVHIYNHDKNISSIPLSTYFTNDPSLDIIFATANGITNFHYLKNDTIEGFLNAMCSSSSKYGITDINTRIMLIKILMSKIDDYSNIKETVDIILNS